MDVPSKPTFRKIHIPTELSWNVRTSISGQKIAFVYDDKLWTLPLSGSLGVDIPGKPIHLKTDGIKVLAAGLSWSYDGNTIAFNEFNEDSSLQDLPPLERRYQKIYIISSLGGKPEKIVENYCDMRMTGWRVGISHDGKILGYSSVNQDGMYIYLKSIEGGTPRKLVDFQAREPVFSPQGRLVAFVEDKESGRLGGGLYTVPVSGGIPNLVADAGNATSPVWSPDASKIAFLDSDEAHRIHIIAVDKNGKPEGEKVSLDIPEEKTEARLLTGWLEENKIGMLVKRDQKGLYTLPADGGPLQLVYSGGAHQPRWSSDGKSIVFRKAVRDNENDWSNHTVAIMPAEGGNEKDILTVEGNQVGTVNFGAGLRISPNGKKIVMAAKKIDEDTVSINRFPVTQIWTVSLQGEELIKITDPSLPYTDGCPCWSPDGKSIAFVRAELIEDRLNPFGKTGIYIIDQSGGKPRLLNMDPDEFKYSIDWSPDSKFLAYVSSNQKNTEDMFLKIVDVSSGVSRTIGRIPTATVHTELAWSPDSKRIAFNDREGKVIKVMSVDDGSEKDIETGLIGGSIYHLDWSPDGAKFVFVGSSIAYPELWVMEDFLPQP